MSIPIEPSQMGHNSPAYLGPYSIYSGTTNTMTPEKDPQAQVLEVPPVGTAQVTEEPPKKSLGSRIGFWASFLAGVLWLVPTGYLLYLNFSETVIGASAWCPGGKCSVITYSSELSENATQNVFMNAVRFSKHDHNLLGVLQVVAKTLEIWFIGIAASLVYTLSRIIATKPGGLPLGHLLAHVEFADILKLTNPSLYTSVRRQQGSTASRKSRRTIFILFVTMVVFLCIVANLIGPMTAVLLMPTLEPDYQTEKVVGDRFSRMRSGFPPSNGNSDIGRFSACNDTQLETGSYGCFLSYYGSTLDDLVDGTMSFMDQAMWNEATGVLFPINYTPTLENNFPFSFNTSIAPAGKNLSTISWATSRQVVRELSRDFNDFAQVVLGNSENESYDLAKNSLSVTLQREAPITGFQSLSSWGNVFILEVDDSRRVRCIEEYQSNDNGDWYWKCFRTGPGWNSTASTTYFAIDPEESNNVTVLGYWSDNSAYFQGPDVRSWDDCFQDTTIRAVDLRMTEVPEDCDWDALFAPPAPADLPPISRDAFVFEFWNSDIREPRVLIYEIHPFAGKADYSVDVTQVYPQVSEVKVERLPEAEERAPISVNPGWLLATWGFDLGTGSTEFNPMLTMDAATQYNVSSTTAFPGASAAGKLKVAVNDMYEVTLGFGLDDGSFDADMYTLVYTRFSYIVQNMALQMMSLVTYDTATDGAPVEGAGGGSDEEQARLHPPMTTSMRLKVWKWGIGSRTSQMGVVITLIACAVILVRSVALMIDRQPKPSTIGIIASLMEHAHRGELTHVPPTKRETAGMVRFKMPELHEDKLVFQHQ